MNKCNKATVFSLPCRQILLGDIKVYVHACVCVCGGVCACVRVARVCAQREATFYSKIFLVTCSTRHETVMDGLQHNQSHSVCVCVRPFPRGMPPLPPSEMEMTNLPTGRHMGECYSQKS